MPRFGKYFKRGADALGALGHDTHPNVRLVERLLAMRKAYAIVAHLKSPLRLLLDVQPHLRCVGMLSCIGERFLYDM